MVFHSMTPEVNPSDTSVTSAAGVVGHRSCATMDVTGVTVPVPYSATVDPASFRVSCEGLQVALPSPTFRCEGCGGPSGAAPTMLSCEDLELVMAEDGLRIGFAEGALELCPGCFIVGGPDNIMATWRTISGSDASVYPIAPPASPYCGVGGPDMSIPAVEGPVTPCNGEENTQLHGEVLNGGTFLTSSMGACCLVRRLAVSHSHHTWQ